MKAVDQFRAFLIHFTDKSRMKHGGLKVLSEKAGVNYKQLSEFKNGKENLSESSRERISRALGFNYIEALLCGKNLIERESLIVKNNIQYNIANSKDSFNLHTKHTDYGNHRDHNDPDNAKMSNALSMLLKIYESNDKIKIQTTYNFLKFISES